MSAQQELCAEDAKGEHVPTEATVVPGNGHAGGEVGRDELRREVRHGPEHGARRGERPGIAELHGDAEINELDRSGARRCRPESFGDEDVVRLEVAVDDLALVDERERLGDLLEERGPVRRRHAGILDEIGERLPVDQLEDQAGHPGGDVLEEAVTNDQRRVRSLGERMGLPPGALERLGRGALACDDLDGAQGAVLKEISRLPDGSLSPLSQRFEKFVPIDALACTNAHLRASTTNRRRMLSGFRSAVGRLLGLRLRVSEVAWVVHDLIALHGVTTPPAPGTGVPRARRGTFRIRMLVFPTSLPSDTMLSCRSPC
nr:hypothetical protein [Polyangium spumosum]